MSQAARVFKVEPAGLNWPRAVVFLDVGLVPLFVFWAIGHEQYLLSTLFGLLFTVLCDPGGGYGRRMSRICLFALIGAGVTALGFGIGAAPWGWPVLAAFAITLVAGLAVAFGVHRFVTALLLNIWFIVTIGVAFTLHRHGHISSHTWAQVLAWTGGAALWIAAASIWWLVSGRGDAPRPFAEIPGDTARRALTRPLVAFALVRALAIAGTVALAFGLDLSYGYWIPIAAMIAMKPSLEQATLVAAQRLTGALIGAVAAALLLLVPASEHGLRLFAVEHGLQMVALVLFMHGAGIRFWNYTFYSACIAAGVLILVDLPQPSHYSAEGYRVLWTLCGVGISLLVMALSTLLTGGGPSGQAAPSRRPAE
ncbi:hypothetical protein amrb99_19290 [Actinomadura sp. RB99]|uniref:FUSC family protein n=1 Tax=Actinomadura sp. RB99 TaxID=2691577 RepID=UPI00168A2D89|nr:FUSC family protein [Actinomadura sp. RB99]MBD2893009.1 hypothetical protein [Actinomadura sp. RB99]